MTPEEAAVLEAAIAAARFLPPPGFDRNSPGWTVTHALAAAVRRLKKARQAKRAARP